MAEPSKILTRAQWLETLAAWRLRNDAALPELDADRAALVASLGELRAALKALLADRFNNAARLRARRAIRKTHGVANG